MESNKPFQYQFFLLQLIGYQHHYVHNWRGILLQCWGYCIWGCLGIGAITGCHCFLTNLDNVTIFTEALAYTVNWTMCFIRVSVFYTQKQRIMKLVDDLLNVTKTGRILLLIFRSDSNEHNSSFWGQSWNHKIHQRIQFENEQDGCPGADHFHVQFGVEKFFGNYHEKREISTL